MNTESRQQAIPTVQTGRHRKKATSHEVRSHMQNPSKPTHTGQQANPSMTSFQGSFRNRASHGSLVCMVTTYEPQRLGRLAAAIHPLGLASMVSEKLRGTKCLLDVSYPFSNGHKANAGQLVPLPCVDEFR